MIMTDNRSPEQLCYRAMKQAHILGILINKSFTYKYLSQVFWLEDIYCISHPELPDSGNYQVNTIFTITGER